MITALPGEGIFCIINSHATTSSLWKVISLNLTTQKFSSEWPKVYVNVKILNTFFVVESNFGDKIWAINFADTFSRRG
jgi:hypothetical protein